MDALAHFAAAVFCGIAEDNRADTKRQIF